MDTASVAQLLAGEHMAEDVGMVEVYSHPAENEVRLLEVSRSVPDSGDVFAFRYAPDPPEVPYPCLVILLRPGDWQRVKNHELDLPASFAERPLERIAERTAA